MLEMLFKNVLIMGTLISICSLPIVFLINNKRIKYNVKAVYNFYCILAVMLIIPIGITIFNNVNLRINTNIEVSDNNIDDYNVEFENENVIFDVQNNFRNHVIENNAIYNFIKYGSVIWIDIALLYWIYTMINYYGYIKSLKIYADTDLMIENYLELLKKEFKLKYKVKYYFSNNISTAITIGLIHKKVIIPTTNKNYSDLTYILKHEVFHIKNNDILFKNILLLVNSIYWFNPIVYYFRKISDEIIELNCDYNILKDKPEEYRIQYGKVLLNQLVISRMSKYVLITSFSDSRRNIMERFSNIVKYDKNKKIMFIAVAIILMLITASGVIYAFNNVSVVEDEKKETPAIKEESSQKEIRKIFDSPIPGATITSRFGKRTVNAEKVDHTGTDFNAPDGTEIRAAADGVVSFAKYKGSYGYMVMIDHSDGVSTLYCHCQESLNVSEGQNVKSGDVIAKVGRTGNTTGPTLHFEVRENGIPQNPENYLK